jgi:sterol O-acyltransferase
MSSANININGNGEVTHDHVLRPRAVKPSHPAILRTITDDKLTPNGTKELLEMGTSTGQTGHEPR